MESSNEDKWIYATIITVILLLVGIIWGYQWFKVFSAEQSGRAELAQAEYNRQIAVREAQAHLDSAKLLAESEVERARGVAQANEIVGQGLKDNEDYLRYLWIQNVTAGEHQVIYIPTEAGLPILEAGKR
jgi:regulator of protease activity HflC (stomatin/prohibitin superfamily)